MPSAASGRISGVVPGLGGCTCLGGVPAWGVYLPRRGVYLPGGVPSPGGVPAQEGVYLPRRGVYLPRRGVYLPGGCTWSRGFTCPGGVPGPGGVPAQVLPPVDRHTPVKT